MTFVTQKDEFIQSLPGRIVRYRMATASYAGTDAPGEGAGVGEAAVGALVGSFGTPRSPGFALNLMSAPSGRLALERLRDVVRRGSAAAGGAGMAILGGHTLDIDALFSSIMTVELLAPQAASSTPPPGMPDPGSSPRRPCMGYSQVHGCGAKLPPDRLAELLPEMIVAGQDPGRRILASDDAVVVALDGDEALAATVDVITPVTNDPLAYGRIAVAGALSDLYAKGSRPVGAAAILGVHPKLDAATRAWILAGAGEKLAEAGAALVGIHEIPSGELFFGLLGVGIAPAARCRRKTGVKAGDRLVLTKPLGTGVISTVEKRTGLAGREGMRDAVRATMEALNAPAAAALDLPGISACTDVTGFSLVGHLLEMLEGHGDLMARLHAGAVPLLAPDDLLPLLDSGMDFCSMSRNRHFLEPKVRIGGAGRGDPRRVDLLFDAQTSGGLLISVAADHLDACLARIRSSGVTAAAVVGSIAPREGEAALEIDAGAVLP